MICDHPECTGNHDDRKYATLCPRSKEKKRDTCRAQHYKHRDKKLAAMARYRTTAAFMLSQARNEAHRRESRETTKPD